MENVLIKSLVANFYGVNGWRSKFGTTNISEFQNYEY